MTDAPLSIEHLANDPTDPIMAELVWSDGSGNKVTLLGLDIADALLVDAQLAAAARVPELEAEIERLQAQVDGLADGEVHAIIERDELRARLAAVPDLTELREAVAQWDNNSPRGRFDVLDAARRLLAAVPSTSTDGGAA